jgi:hypothetical protein
MPTTGSDPSGKGPDPVPDAIAALHGLHGRNPHSLTSDQIVLLLREDKGTTGKRTVHLTPDEIKFLGRLLASKMRTAQPGTHAPDPNAKMRDGTHPAPITSNHQRAGQKKGGPASGSSTIDVTSRLVPRSSLGPGVIDVTSSFGPVDDFGIDDLVRQMTMRDQMAYTNKRMTALRSNPALMKKAAAANAANIARARQSVASRSKHAESTLGQIFTRSTGRYMLSGQYALDYSDFLGGAMHSAVNVVNPVTYWNGANAAFDRVAEKGLRGGAREFGKAFVNSLTFWDKEDMCSAGESFMNVEMLLAPALKKIPMPGAITALEDARFAAWAGSPLAKQASAGFANLGKGIGSTLGEAGVIKPVVAAVNRIAVIPAKLAFALGHRATLWSGFGAGALTDALELKSLGYGTTIEGTVGGSILNQTHAALRWLDAGRDVGIADEVWNLASETFASSPRLQQTTAALRQIRNGVQEANVTAKMLREDAAFRAEELPILEDRNLVPTYVTRSQMATLPHAPLDFDPALWAWRTALWSVATGTRTLGAHDP